MGKSLKNLRQNIVLNENMPQKGDLLIVNGKSEEIIATDGKYFFTKKSQYRKTYKGIEGFKKKPKKEAEDEPV